MAKRDVAFHLGHCMRLPNPQKVRFTTGTVGRSCPDTLRVHAVGNSQSTGAKSLRHVKVAQASPQVAAESYPRPPLNNFRNQDLHDTAIKLAPTNQLLQR